MVITTNTAVVDLPKRSHLIAVSVHILTTDNTNNEGTIRIVYAFIGSDDKPLNIGLNGISGKWLSRSQYDYSFCNWDGSIPTDDNYNTRLVLNFYNPNSDNVIIRVSYAYIVEDY